MTSRSTLTPSDQDARERAIDPARSCIVQAPAGSGKTTLLVQRYLNLLCVVAKPEEILAITFTRKAATEMKQRILQALERDDAIAARVRQRDSQLGWGIQQNPNRLKVQTIDSFAMELATKIPRQESVAGLRLLESPDHLYQAAVRALFEQLSSKQTTAPYIAEFLAFLNNDATSASTLLTQMLARRDQWLDFNNAFTLHYAGAPEKIAQLLAQALNNLRQQILQAAEPEFSAAQKADIQAVYRQVFSDPTEDDFQSALCAMAPLLLTGKKLRKSIDKRAHAAFAEKNLRDTVKALLVDLAEGNVTEHLQHIRQLPSATIDSDQTNVLETISVCLALSAIALQQIFVEEGAIDFTELMIRASSGLRDESGPTDLALHFDYQIHHLLVDEFQDTSRSQLSFFQLLTEGWQADDNNTVFVVGDPMQSIYRFRDADVAIFSHCMSHGLGDLPLEALHLTNNFRSAKELVDWNNELFDSLLPSHSAPRLGAVSFAQAEAARRTDPHASKVLCYAFGQSEHEVSAVVSHIESLHHSGASIGVLCRSRSHLTPLLTEMSAAGINWRSTDIDLLADVAVIQDLMNLYRILQNPEHRLSWFSVLRSPLIGLRLSQLQELEEVVDFAAELPDFVQRFIALQRLIDGLQWAHQHQFEFPLREILEGLWLRLGGMEAYDKTSLNHAMRWFELLEELGPAAYQMPELERSVARLFANSAGDAPVEVMTIHKAKGLQFDHVIVPFLHRGTRQDTAPLMLWQADASNLLIGARNDPIHAWLDYEDKIRAANERKRLLYVACTRARDSLWLSYETANPDQAKGMAEWIKELAEYVAPLNAPGTAKPADEPPLLTALPEDFRWQQPDVIGATIKTDATNTATDLIGSRYEVALGHLVHKALAWMANTQTLDIATLAQRMSIWAQHLDVELERTSELVADARHHLQQVCSSEHGKWVLSEHEQAQCEWAISGADQNGQVHNVVLDRYFVTNQQRWIIDYKTALPDRQSTPMTRQAFLQNQAERYRPQLDRYRHLVAELCADDPLPIRTALFFTGIAELYEL